ncbi:MAG: hypothetical protein IJU93_06205 [Lachnospiraceae bacterium]|nr:hypothetical protein [Lachnospiraceae bacterium]
MKFPIFTSIILLVIIFQINLRRINKKEAQQEKEYWERERAAFIAPRKDISGLDYIKMPEGLPLDFPIEDKKAEELRTRLINLSKQKIINLYGMSNTDIRLTYGALNFETLSMADTRYLIFIRTLSELAGVYYDQGFIDEARTILEYAIDIDSDVRNTYVLLTKIYKAAGETEKVAGLKEKAENIKTLSRDGVVAALNEIELDELLDEGEPVSL